MNEVQPGMVLAKPVMNSSGMVIVGAGLTLDDAVIDRLTQLGKEAIYVEGTPVLDVARSLAEQERELHHRFRKVQADGRLMKIRDAIKAHLRRVAQEPSRLSSSPIPIHEANEACAGDAGVRPGEQGTA
jgi:hypothetical protein